MKMFQYALVASLLISAPAFAEKFELDKPHTDISFKAPHLVISTVRGKFTDFNGSFEFDEKTQKLSDVMVTIKADSITTDNADRDKHLRSPDFFDVAKFGEITFKGNDVKYSGKKPDKVIGDLTIRGVTKKVTLDVDYNGTVTDPWGSKVLAFEAEVDVNRKDFNMIWNKMMDKGGGVVGDKIKIKIMGEAKPAKVAAAVEPAKPAK